MGGVGDGIGRHIGWHIEQLEWGTRAKGETTAGTSRRSEVSTSKPVQSIISSRPNEKTHQD